MSTAGGRGVEGGTGSGSVPGSPSCSCVWSVILQILLQIDVVHVVVCGAELLDQLLVAVSGLELDLRLRGGLLELLTAHPRVRIGVVCVIHSRVAEVVEGHVVLRATDRL